MLVVSRSDPGLMEHRVFSELPGFFGEGDAMVFNTSRVLAARFVGQNARSGGRVSGLFLERVDDASFVALIKARRVREGSRLEVWPAEAGGVAGGVGDGVDRGVDGVAAGELRVVSRAQGGGWVVMIEGGVGVDAFLERYGRAALPPYILKARERDARLHGGGPDEREDRERYQTVYAGTAGASVAAPTAGLHFTPEVLGGLEARGVARGDVVLDVGRGTFEPVEAEHVEEHTMHRERCVLPPVTEQLVRSGRRVTAVGTTSARTLESFALARERGETGGVLETDLLITPGYRWRWVDGLVTNFHLPRSTLLAMVSAMFGDGMDGVERLRWIYDRAVRERYRFFSYGDAMLILP